VGFGLFDYAKGLATRAVSVAESVAKDLVQPAVDARNGDIGKAALGLGERVLLRYNPLAAPTLGAVNLVMRAADVPKQVIAAVNAPTDQAAGEIALEPAMTVGEIGGLIYGGIRGGFEASPTEKSVGELAKAQADIAQELASKPRPGTVATPRVGDRVIEGQTKTGTPHHPLVQEMLDNVKNRSDFHGKCAEINCLDNAYSSEVSPAGGEIGTAKVRAPGNAEHGQSHEPCSTCADVLQQADVTYSEN
jgi:hypothetical protein